MTDVDGAVPDRPYRNTTLVALAAFVLVFSVLTLVQLPYVVMSPGPATDVLGEVDGKPVLTIEGQRTYETNGSLYFTTVTVSGGPDSGVGVLDMLRGWLAPNSKVVPRDQIYPPGQSDEEAQAESIADMRSSQEVSAAVALRALGEKVPARVLVTKLSEDSPSEGKLSAGDEILKIDGVDADTATAVSKTISAMKPGTTVNLLVKRGGVERTEEIVTEDNHGRAVIGVFLEVHEDLPVKVNLNTGNVGGPSAGLMFSLAMYDILSPGDLTSGKNIAGTGTMSDGGQVGPIGGIEQKMAGALEDGATWFLAPAANCPEVVDHVPDGMNVVRVTSFDDARAAVVSIGKGDLEGLPTCDADSHV